MEVPTWWLWIRGLGYDLAGSSGKGCMVVVERLENS